MPHIPRILDRLRKRNAPPPDYSPLDPFPSIPAQSKTISVNDYMKGTIHPDLADPRDNVCRILRVNQPEESIARVFDPALRRDFTTMQQKFKNKPQILNTQIGLESLTGYLRSEIRVVDSHHLVHTCFRVWGASERQVRQHLRESRYSDAAYYPCPHLHSSNAPQPALYFPAEHNECEASNFHLQALSVGGFQSRQANEVKYGPDKICQLCVTSFAALSYRESGKLNIELNTWHDLGLLESPLETEWVRLAAVVSSALTHPDPPYHKRASLRRRFETADRTL